MRLFDRVRQTATLASTTMFTLPGTIAPDGFVAFANVYPNFETLYYAAVRIDGAWEVGKARFEPDNTIRQRQTMSVHPDPAKALQVGDVVDLFVTQPGAATLLLDDIGNFDIGSGDLRSNRLIAQSQLQIGSSQFVPTRDASLNETGVRLQMPFGTGTQERLSLTQDGQATFTANVTVAGTLDAQAVLVNGAPISGGGLASLPPTLVAQAASISGTIVAAQVMVGSMPALTTISSQQVIDALGVPPGSGSNIDTVIVDLPTSGTLINVNIPAGWSIIEIMAFDLPDSSLFAASAFELRGPAPGVYAALSFDGGASNRITLYPGTNSTAPAAVDGTGFVTSLATTSGRLDQIAVVDPNGFVGGKLLLRRYDAVGRFAPYASLPPTLVAQAATISGTVVAAQVMIGAAPALTTISGTMIEAALGYTPLSANQTITLSGDLTGSGSTAITATLASTPVVPGTYTVSTIVVDSKGRIQSAANGVAGAGGGSGQTLLVELTSGTGTIAIPPWAVFADYEILGGGGGGGSGSRQGTAGTSCSGGGAGGGGAAVYGRVAADALRTRYPTGIPYVVGAGGLGGAPVTTGAGQAGQNGGLTLLGGLTVTTALHGAGGGGFGMGAATNANAASGGAGGAVFASANGGSAPNAQGVGAGATTASAIGNPFGGGGGANASGGAIGGSSPQQYVGIGGGNGGASGAGINASNLAFTGGNMILPGNVTWIGFTGGTSTFPGPDGVSPPRLGGSGGAGGGANASGNATRGGNGGFPAGGGGGGGSIANVAPGGSTSGGGGNGGGGVIRIVWAG